MKLPLRIKWLSWPHVVGAIVTAALLWLVFRRIDFAAVWVALRRVHVTWLALAFAAYGLAIWLGGFRWHLALSLTDRAIHPSASCRLMLVGHFFFTALFGAAGGDFAKSAVYARWFRFALPEVIAAAPLDRTLGLGAAIITAGLTLGLAAASGGFANLQKIQMQMSGVWLLAGIIALALLGITLVFWRPEGESVWARTVRAFRVGGGRLLVTPRTAAAGTAWALFCQFMLSSVFALNLQAVSPVSVPWLQLAWTFPAITILSCLPFTVAGAGVREVAAITLLGLYGVPAGDCVAAALLTLVMKLLWAALGAVVLWRGEVLHAQCADHPLPQTISAIIPTLNEAESLPETLRRAQAIPEIRETIIVDGGSRDATKAIAEQRGCRVLNSPPGRGVQMRLGAQQAVGDVVLLLHADTWLPPNAGRAALNCLRDPSVVAGGFWKIFRDAPLLMRGARWRCAVRFFVGRRILGDQAMFIRRDALERIGGVPDVPLMEELELCRRLRKIGRLALADATVVTSARRFKERGVIRTYLRMWQVSALYRLGRSPQELRRLYEKK